MLRNIMTVLSGTVLAQLIGVLCLPVLTRLYDPSAFGQYQIYLSGMSILLMAVAFRYEVALLSAEKGRAFKNLFALTLRICLFSTLASVVVILLFGPWLAQTVPSAGHILWLFPAGMLLGGIFQAMTFLPIRHRDYKLAASSKVVQVGGFVGFSILFSFSWIAGIGLAIGDMLGRILATIQILRKSPREEVIFWRKLSWADAKEALRMHRSFPLYVFPGTLITAISLSVVPLTFATHFSVEVAGQYALVERFLFIPVGMIAFAVSQVFSGDLAEEIRTNPADTHRKFRHLLKMLGLMAAAFAGLGWLILETAVPIVFGSQWALAGELATVALPFVALMFLSSPVNMVLVISGYRKTQFGWDMSRSAALILTYWLLREQPDGTPQSVMLVYASVGTLTYTVFLFLADRALAQTSARAR
jgi:O-antigen/teichoic acid export membrane protein